MQCAVTEPTKKPTKIRSLSPTGLLHSEQMGSHVGTKNAAMSRSIAPSRASYWYYTVFFGGDDPFDAWLLYVTIAQRIYLCECNIFCDFAFRKTIQNVQVKVHYVTTRITS